MTENASANDGKRRLTRRGLLTVAGVSAVAGCSSIDTIGGGGADRIRGYDLPEIDEESIPQPVVAPAVPVDVDPKYSGDSQRRVNELLAELPTPFGPAAIPNGHIREHLTDAAAAATDDLDDARTARTDTMVLQSLRSARAHARYAAAGWAVADRGLSVDPLRREHRQVVAEARSTLDSREYLATDPIRATLVHARVERLLNRVVDARHPRTRADSELLRIAQWAETAEEARVRFDDARQLNIQFEASLPDDVETVAATISDTADTLATDARSRQSELPPEPTSEEWGLPERVVDELRGDLDRGPYSIDEADGPASAVVDLVDRLVRFRALDRIEERVDAGEIASAGSAEAVREARTTAYSALESALADSPAPGLARTVLSPVSWRVSHADREVSRKRSRDDLSPSSLDDVMERYIVATAVARATSTVCQRAVDTLRSA